MFFKFQRFQLALGFVFEQPIKRGMLFSKWATINNLLILFGFRNPPPPGAKELSVILVPINIGGEPQ